MFWQLETKASRIQKLSENDLCKHFEIHFIAEKENEKSFAFMSALSQQSVYLIQEVLGIPLLRE